MVNKGHKCSKMDGDWKMVISSNRAYSTNDSDIFVVGKTFKINESTEEGRIMAELYKSNYPFVDFEHDGEYVTKVIVLENEKEAELDRIEQERLEQQLLENLKPSEKEILMAEIELSTINLLLELEVI